MKIGCPCGAVLVDQTDALPGKAHIVPDQAWFGLLDAIDAAIEETGPSAAEREAACMRVRSLIASVTRFAWQCASCGRLFVDDADNALRCFAPEGEAVKEIFRAD